MYEKKLNELIVVECVANSDTANSVQRFGGATQWFLVLRKIFIAQTQVTKPYQKPLSDLFILINSGSVVASLVRRSHRVTPRRL